jgi:butyrate kinase
MEPQAIGFTGTRRDLPHAQALALARILTACQPSELHHGDCIGADALAHQIAKALGWRVVSHPGQVAVILRANMVADEIRPARPPLDRNDDIVSETARLIACPGSDHEEIRSGTWSTVRTARRLGKPRTIVWPDGRVDEETDDPSC